MAALADPVAPAPKKRSKMPLILGLVLLLAGAGGGFLAVRMGLIGAAGADSADPVSAAGDHAGAHVLAPVSFVPIDPLIVSLPGGGGVRHLRFTTQLEVPPEFAAEVEAIKPRVVDVLNGYLRAVEIADLEDPSALMRLRAQMLRRVQVVTGEGRVSDLLIMEFVLN